MKSFNDLDRTKLALKLQTRGRVQAALFALLCTERLRACYRVFCLREQIPGSYRIFDECMEFGFGESLASLRRSPDTRKLKLRAKKLDSIVIDTEEFGDGLAVQAQCATIALTYALEVFDQQKDFADSSSWAAYKNMEAIYSYLESLVDKLGVPIEKSVLYQRELDAQQSSLLDLEKFQNSEEVSRETIQQLRRKSAEGLLPVIPY